MKKLAEAMKHKKITGCKRSSVSSFPSYMQDEDLPDYPENEPAETTYNDPFYALQSGTLSGNDRRYGEV